MQHENLNGIFDVDPALAEPVVDAEVVPIADAMATAVTALAPTEPAAAPAPVEAAVNKDLDEDFAYARENITELIKNTTEAAKSAIVLAQSGDSPRAYEVVGKMLTDITNAHKELVNLHRAKQESQPQTDNNGTPGITIDKAVFVGTAVDLIRELRKLKTK